MKSVLYYMMPYAPTDLMVIRTNDDGTYSMRTLIGMYDDEYGPSKKRFDLRSWKPYVTTSDFQDTKKVLDRIRADCLGNDMDSIGYSYGIYNQKVHAHHEFVQAGYDDKVLVVITKKHRYEGEPIDCKVAVINRKERERISPWTKKPYISLPGTWSWHRYEEIKYLNEDAVTLIDRPTAAKMAMELFNAKWENKLADFKEWCGVTE